MRTISIRILGALALVLAFAACGGDDDGDDGGDGNTIDAPAQTIDAPVVVDAPAATNALGQVCTLGAADACPAGNTCVAIMNVGSQTMGWCSPMCMNMNSICSTGYTGPAGGMPVCAITEMTGAPPTLCAIICNPAMQQCPTGLTCQMVNAQTSICAAPP